jgi:Tfp pilus assembly protein PilF
MQGGPSTTSDDVVQSPWPETIAVVLLFVLAAGCYLNTLGHGFVYDDEIQILQNPYVTSWHYLPQIFRTTVWSFIGAAGATNYYRPLMTLTFLLLWKVFGGFAVGFHLFNLLLNTLVVSLVFYGGRALFRSPRIGFLSAVLFAVHPVHTEAVNWIAAVTDLEATLLFLLAFYLHVTEAWGNVKSRIFVPLFFLLSLLAKEPAFMLAPLLVLYEHFVRENRKQTSFAEKAKHYTPVCAVALGYLGLRIVLFGKLAPVLQHAQISWPEAFYSAFALITQYTRLLFLAAPLSAFHVFHVSQSLWSKPVLAGIIIVTACVVFILATWRRWPKTAFCVVWIGITLAPVLNARWMAANVLTERYLYLPSVAFCWLAGSVLVDSWERLAFGRAARASRLALLAAVLILALIGVTRTWQRNRVWQNDFTLYGETIKTDPDSYIMHMNLAISLLETRNLAEAEKELDYALQLKPDSANVLNALGCVYLDQGRLPEAAQTLQKAISLRPDWSDPHFNYGRVLQKLGSSNEAMTEFRTAVRVGPLNASAHLTLADALKERGDEREAEAEYRKSLELHPNLHAQQELADLMIRTGRDDDAENILRETLKEYPIDSRSHLRLAELMEKHGRFEEARRQYQATLLTDPNNPEVQAALRRLKSPQN